MLKRIFFKLLVFTVICGGVASYVASINGVNVKKVLQTASKNFRLPNINMPSLPDLPDTDIKKLLPDKLSSHSKAEQIYKWQDDRGVWHFSQEKPPGTEVEAITLTPNRNLVKATELAAASEPNEERTPYTKRIGGKTSDSSEQETLGSPYSPEGIKKLMEDARGVQELVNKRNEVLSEEANRY